MAETRRDEQKLWLILFQIKGVRSRLNFLAMQRWLFALLTLLIGAAGLTLFAAAVAGPLTFLAVALAAITATTIGIIRETLLARAMRTSPARAAAIADERSQMKGRLTTVLALAATPKRSPLWAYLVEDTYGQRTQFEPSRIVPRWLSRAVYPLLATILLAGLALPAARISNTARRGPMPPGTGARGQITADIRNLDIRPADPALQPNAEIYADPETLRKLANKLAAAENADHERSKLSKMMDKARSFADAFQDKLNGLDHGRKPLRLRLTDRNPAPSPPGGAAPPKNENSAPVPKGNAGGGSGLADNSRHNQGGPGHPGAPGGGGPPMTSLPPPEADQLASGDRHPSPSSGSDQPGSPENPADSNGPIPGAGSSHGSGSDPAGLFGPSSAQPLGSDSFKIAIEAEPSNESTASGSPTYVPPRIRVPLNSVQYPDQPLARTSVPTADQDTIKRVFER